MEKLWLFGVPLQARRCDRLPYSGALMSTFTGRELEFLAGLNRSWWTLYCRELARLQRDEDTSSNAQQEVHAAIERSDGVVRRSAAKILAFAQNAN
jgi:hypothetical protein